MRKKNEDKGLSEKQIRKSWEKYQAQIKEWITTGKYEEWQFADNIITNFETYAQAYISESAALKLLAKTTKKKYLLKENITRRIANQAIVFKRTTISKIAKGIGISFKQTRDLIKVNPLANQEIWDRLISATADYDEASFWYSVFVPGSEVKTKRGREPLTRAEVFNILFGDMLNGQTT